MHPTFQFVSLNDYYFFLFLFSSLTLTLSVQVFWFAHGTWRARSAHTDTVEHGTGGDDDGGSGSVCKARVPHWVRCFSFFFSWMRRDRSGRVLVVDRSGRMQHVARVYKRSAYERLNAAKRTVSVPATAIFIIFFGCALLHYIPCLYSPALVMFAVVFTWLPLKRHRFFNLLMKHIYSVNVIGNYHREYALIYRKHK